MDQIEDSGCEAVLEASLLGSGETVKVYSKLGTSQICVSGRISQI